MATEQGTRQAGEVGELMTSTADVLEESIRATEQQKQAAEQVSAAMVQIRTAAEQLAAEGSKRTDSAQQPRSDGDSARAAPQTLAGKAHDRHPGRQLAGRRGPRLGDRRIGIELDQGAPRKLDEPVPVQGLDRQAVGLRDHGYGRRHRRIDLVGEARVDREHCVEVRSTSHGNEHSADE